jgi:mRNA interferase YafQ
MLQPRRTNRFVKEVERAKKRGKDLKKLEDLIKLLLQGKQLPPKYDDHPLKGNYEGTRECKVEPDWLIVYERTKTEIILRRTGTHSDLFKN